MQQTTGGGSIHLSLQLEAGEDIDETDLDALTRALRSELEEIPVVTEVGRASEAGPQAGAKGVGELLGKLLLAVAPDGVNAVIGFLKEWTLRPGNRPVIIKVQGDAGALEVEYDPRTMTTEDVKKLAAELQALVSG